MGLSIVVSNYNDKPIYSQIADQVRAAILSGELSAGDELPSVRRLAQDLRVSAITTKRAYDDLEREGFLVGTQGRGTFVAEPNLELVRESKLRELEAIVVKACSFAKASAIARETVEAMLDLAWREDDR